MAFIPGYFDESTSYWEWTKEQKIAYITLFYTVAANYCLLVVLALRNICVILVKQKEYKNLPILTFYGYSLLAVTLRPIYIIWYWTYNRVIIFNSDFVQ